MSVFDGAPAQGNATVNAPIRSEPVRGRGGRILVVDDEQILCTTIQRVLAGQHQVTAVTAARDALQRVGGGERYDLILCDLMMPGMTGMDLHRELLQQAPEQAQKMIFMTGGAFTEDASRFLAQVANPTIDKPFKASKLRQLIQSLLQ